MVPENIHSHPATEGCWKLRVKWCLIKFQRKELESNLISREMGRVGEGGWGDGCSIHKTHCGPRVGIFSVPTQ